MGLWKMIFKPNDGTRREVTEAVEASKQDRDIANSRFEETIRDLLNVNDKLTGRQNAQHRT